MSGHQGEQHLNISDAGGTIRAQAHSPSSLSYSLLVSDHLCDTAASPGRSWCAGLSPGRLDSSVPPKHLCPDGACLVPIR